MKWPVERFPQRHLKRSRSKQRMNKGDGQTRCQAAGSLSLHHVDGNKKVSVCSVFEQKTVGSVPPDMANAAGLASPNAEYSTRYGRGRARNSDTVPMSQAISGPFPGARFDVPVIGHCRLSSS